MVRSGSEAVRCPLCGHDGAAAVAEMTRARLVRCRACGLAYRDPLKRPDEIRKEYDDVYTRPAVATRLDDHRRPVFAEFLTRVTPTGGGRVLDVGCGTGSFLEIARTAGWRTSGVELSARGAATTRTRGHAVYATSKAVAAASMEAVTLWNVLDYFAEPLPALEDFHRVLVPGGVLFVRTPNEAFQLTAYRLSRLVRRPRALGRLLEDAFYFHSLLWSPRTLRTALERAGFADFKAWSSRPSSGDPYHERRRVGEAATELTKRVAYAAARGVAALTRGRLTLGTSIVALARKPVVASAPSA